MKDREEWFIDRVLAMVKLEVSRTMLKHKTFNSYHEGYAVILEEMDELWDEIKKRTPCDPAIRTEAIQISAMAVRFLIDLTSASA